MNRLSKKLICLAVALLAAVLAGELLFRFMGFLPSAAEPDYDIGWRWTPRARYRFDKEGFSEGRFNRFGMRDVERDLEKPAGIRRIALLGDSFVEGLTVSLENSAAFLAEQMLQASGIHAEILNFARSGMGPTEELIVLKRDALRFSPDAVCLVYLPGNDISDALPQTATDTARPFAHRTENGIAITQDFRNSRSYRIRKMINPVKQRSALISWCISRIRFVQQKRIRATLAPSDPNPLKSPQGVTSLFTDHPEPLYEKALAVNMAVLDEVQRVCSSNRIPLGVVILPAYLYSTPQELDEAGIDPRAVSRRIQEWAAERGVECLPLQQSFEEEIARGARLHYFFGPELWNYGHFNEEGYALAARLLADFLAVLLPGDPH